jgi:phosphatidylinositol alpha-1,6-mannosyltransferase
VHSAEDTKSILVIASEFPPGPGGIGHHAYSLAKALRESSYEVSVLSPADYVTSEEVNNFDASQSFKIIRFRRAGVLTYFYRIYLSTRFLINNKRYKYVILTGRFPLWLGIVVNLLFPSKKKIVILHGTEINLPNKILRWLTHKSISIADTIVPVSEFTRSLLPASILEKHRNIVVIKNGIDNVWSENSVLGGIKLEGNPVLLTVGHVSPRKGQHRVISALPALITRYPYVHYHIVGLPLNQTSLEQLARDLGVMEYITFHGRVASHTDLQIYYNAADIFMLLSENQPSGGVEGFGIVALEANLHGLPVIGAKYCGVEEAVSHKQSGYLVDGDREEEILEGVVYCLQNKPELDNGSRDWARKHQWIEIAKQYTTLFS